MGQYTTGNNYIVAIISRLTSLQCPIDLAKGLECFCSLTFKIQKNFICLLLG